MLRMEAVTKNYNHRSRTVTALRGASIHVPKGDYVSVVGPSGSGKSTLLLMIGGMLSPTEGRVFLDGESLYDLAPDERAAVRKRSIGFVFQTFNLVPYLTALESSSALHWHACWQTIPRSSWRTSPRATWTRTLAGRS